MFPIKYIDNNLVWNKDNEVFAYYELIPYNYSFLSAEQKFIVHDSFRQLIAQSREGKIHATGIFTKSSINPVAKWDGLIYGDYHLFAAQIIGIIFTIAVAVVGTLICVAIVRIFTPLRVSVREEQVGLDISEHGESAYPSFNGLDQ